MTIVPLDPTDPPEWLPDTAEECPHCNGEGTVPDDFCDDMETTCSHCCGSGYLEPPEPDED
jgi:DnaJ-class molecular chaperone